MLKLDLNAQPPLEILVETQVNINTRDPNKTAQKWVCTRLNAKEINLYHLKVFPNTLKQRLAQHDGF